MSALFAVSGLAVLPVPVEESLYLSRDPEAALTAGPAPEAWMVMVVDVEV